MAPKTSTRGCCHSAKSWRTCIPAPALCFFILFSFTALSRSLHAVAPARDESMLQWMPVVSLVAVVTISRACGQAFTALPLLQPMCWFDEADLPYWGSVLPSAVTSSIFTGQQHFTSSLKIRRCPQSGSLLLRNRGKSILRALVCYAWGTSEAAY